MFITIQLLIGFAQLLFVMNGGGFLKCSELSYN